MANGNIKPGIGPAKKATMVRPSGVKMREPVVSRKPPQPAIPYPVTKR